MIVLGIDPGTATTGYGFITENEAGDLAAVAYGVITTPAGAPPASRLLELHCQLQELILLHRPDTSAVEKLYFARNVTTALAVGQSRGHYARVGAGRIGSGRVFPTGNQTGSSRLRRRRQEPDPTYGEGSFELKNNPSSGRCSRRPGGRHLPYLQLPLPAGGQPGLKEAVLGCS